MLPSQAPELWVYCFRCSKTTELNHQHKRSNSSCRAVNNRNESMKYSIRTLQRRMGGVWVPEVSERDRERREEGDTAEENWKRGREQDRGKERRVVYHALCMVPVL